MYINSKYLYRISELMTKLGKYLAQKSVNKAEVSRRAGISKSRLTQLSNNLTTKLTAEELYKIALSISVTPCDLLNVVCEGITLKEVDKSGDN